MDRSMIAAALCFWSTSTKTFDFGCGPMGPSVMDMSSLTSLPPEASPQCFTSSSSRASRVVIPIRVGQKRTRRKGIRRKVEYLLTWLWIVPGVKPVGSVVLEFC
ncbi:hypothetical protein FCV25MIE_17521 [Fagus crenata]